MHFFYSEIEIAAMRKTFLAPGFRFHPTDVELVKYYLKGKVLGKKFKFEAIAEIDIYKYAPWELPGIYFNLLLFSDTIHFVYGLFSWQLIRVYFPCSDKSCLPGKDEKWYFFCPRERKYASGARIKRSTEDGHWKTTGKDRPVHYNGEVVGTIKTLVFHIGRAPDGKRTNWVMHEYTLREKGLEERGVIQVIVDFLRFFFGGNSFSLSLVLGC